MTVPEPPTIDDIEEALDMTLTSAACPMTDVIEDQTRAALVAGPGGGLAE
jgi:metal-sulfur cluster biosynthetic enzyme